MYLAAVVFFARRNEKKNHRQSLRAHFSQPWGRKNKNKVGGKERAGVCEWESFASEEVGEGGKNCLGETGDIP